MTGVVTVHQIVLRSIMETFDRPVMQNSLRSMYVEEQVGVHLGDDWEHVGADWCGWDFKSTTGVRLEVKQSAAKQSWIQDRPSRGSFDIRPRTGRYEGPEWVAGVGRFADVYVFAWHGRWEEADQRDEHQWQYYVVPTRSLPLTQKTIRLSVVEKLAPPTAACDLSSVVGALELIRGSE